MVGDDTESVNGGRADAGMADADSSDVSNLPENSDNPANEADSRHPVASVAVDFMRRVQEMELAAVVAIPAIGEHLEERRAKLKETIRPYIIEEDEKGFSVRFPADPRGASTLKMAAKEFKRLHSSRIFRTVSRSLFIGLFCEFDAFIGSLLKTIYSRNESLYSQIKREVSFSDLIKFDSVDEIKKYILEKEIESFRRESYVEQFSLLEKKFSISLTKFPEWPKFVEISQRRNLMTHNDGVVSNQYLDVCDRAGYNFKRRPIVGEQLEISSKYYFGSTRVLSTVAFMLVYTLWKKIFTKEAKEANDALTVAIYDILADQTWGLAARLADFSLAKEMIKDVDDLNFRIRCINYSIGLYRCNEREKCTKFLQSKDWSACIPDFRLAVAVLSDDFPEACRLMHDIGKEGVLVKQSSYHDWPLFFQFRELPEFLDSYEKIYGAPFNPSIGEELSVSNAIEVAAGASEANNGDGCRHQNQSAPSQQSTLSPALVE